eukprot:TRINITY_DN39255_c0_g1_i1.p1 TRINITY_DN39255_c0_g1~~TRINITY_DN39255_c0_g1_i1.p1  ORF type:complete len:148 (+),score=0.27 TRINITY_DN39255_c0_g1_i1:26-445(+)
MVVPVTTPKILKVAGWYFKTCRSYKESDFRYDYKLYSAGGDIVKCHPSSLKCPPKDRGYLQFRFEKFGYKEIFKLHRWFAFQTKKCNPKGYYYRSGDSYPFLEVDHRKGKHGRNCCRSNLVVLTHRTHVAKTAKEDMEQ